MRLAAGNQVAFTSHAVDRMDERGATSRDLIKGILTATRAGYQTNHENWKLTGGVDLDGDDMIIVVDFVGDLLVITIW